MNTEQQAIHYLKMLRALDKNNSSLNTVYLPPAQQLRNAADAVERKDKLISAIDQFLSEQII